MAETVEQYFVEQYQNNIRILSQQRESRLEGTTLPPVQMIGENLYWERLGKTDAVLVGRHDDTPNIEADHSRRKSTASMRVWATLLDNYDQVRMLVDPRNYYNQIARMALLRAKDTEIIRALGGSAWSGKTGTVEVVLPAGQKIAVGGTGLTVEKLITAKEMLDEAEVDPQAERYVACASHQISDLLAETEVTSADYNTVRALVRGEVDTFMGFRFIRTQLLTLAAAVRYCYAYAKGAVGFGMLNDIESKIDQRSDKNYSWQVWNKMDIGASRIEDEMVVEIAASEV